MQRGKKNIMCYWHYYYRHPHFREQESEEEEINWVSQSQKKLIQAGASSQVVWYESIFLTTTL